MDIGLDFIATAISEASSALLDSLYYFVDTSCDNPANYPIAL
jgi:hypothetical protein